MKEKKLYKAFLGEKLGEGRDRSVYVFKFDSSYVVKIDNSNRFANIIEWDIWNHFYKQRPDLKDYFAPCHSISDCGKVLIQKRTTPILFSPEIEIPKFFWDLTRKNFGWLNGRIVCHDYSNHTLYSHVNVELHKVKLS